MGVDEEGTLAQLRACRRDLIDPGIARRRDRIVKTTGDGLLIEFTGPVEATRWAVDIAAAGMPPHRRFAPAALNAGSRAVSSR